MPNIPCDFKIDCPCDDSPFANLSSEAPDLPVFIANYYAQQTPPLGVYWDAFFCTGVCESTVSQEAANLCAAQLAFDCAVGSWRYPVPGSCGGNPACVPVPPAVSHRQGAAKMAVTNTPQVGTAKCPDGLIFMFEVPAGIFSALTQAQADAQALSYANRQAQLRQICLSIDPSGPVCADVPLTLTVTASGKYLATVGQTDLWVLESGTLPPGMEFNGGNLQGGQATITGTPTTPGSYFFIVGVTDPKGDFMAKGFTVVIAGVTSELPDADVGTAYDETISTVGFTNPVFTLVSGQFPDGLVLGSNGDVTGTPTTAQSTLAIIGITDSNGLSCRTSVTMNAVQNCNIQPDPLPDVQEGLNFLAFLTAPDFTNPVFTPLDALPPGFGFNPGNAALFAFPATAAGTYHFTMQVDGDGGQSCQKVLTVVVGARPPIVWNIVWPAPTVDLGIPNGTATYAFAPTGYTNATANAPNNPNQPAPGDFQFVTIQTVAPGGGIFTYTGPGGRGKAHIVVANDALGAGGTWGIDIKQDGNDIFNTGDGIGVGEFDLFMDINAGVNSHIVIITTQTSDCTAEPLGTVAHVNVQITFS